jgi:hypothetical protein
MIASHSRLSSLLLVLRFYTSSHLTWRGLTTVEMPFRFLSIVQGFEQANMLCDICVGVLTHRANLIAKHDSNDGWVILCAHHRISETLERSVAEGCHICQAFWLQLSEVEQEALRAAESDFLLANPDRPEERPDMPDAYFEWLTHTLLISNTWNSGGDYLFTVRFSAEGIDWKSVTSKDPHAQGIHVIQTHTGMLSAPFPGFELS